MGEGIIASRRQTFFDFLEWLVGLVIYLALIVLAIERSVNSV